MAASIKSKTLFQVRRSFARKEPSRIPRPIVLIVCEGKKTEPKYFIALRKMKRISPEQIPIIGGEGGSHPRSIVKHAKFLKQEFKKEGLSVDEVWCVFDRDVHRGIEAAFQQANANQFNIAFSNPSFELWYLLHYKDQTSHIERREVIRKLKRYIQRYHKAMEVYQILLGHQSVATKRAQDLRKYHRDNQDQETKNPSTSVDQLVSYLNSLEGPGIA